MSSVSYFAPAFKSSSATEKLRTSSGGSSKKRKRGAASPKSGSGNQAMQGPSSLNDLSSSTSPVGSSPRPSIALKPRMPSHDAAVQYEASGQPIDEDLPGGDFPHAFSLESGTSKANKSRIEDDLATLQPLLCISTGTNDTTVSSLSGTSGLRQRHLAVMTAILHRSVLEDDYIRAGRAWGMLLRTEQGGHSMDLRSNGRWGLGAEILLHRGRQVSRKDHADVGSSDQHDISDSDREARTWFSSESFEKAKNYYERLVLQYPYRKAFPTAIGPPDFYFAMFGLWIHSVQEQRGLALASINGFVDEGTDGRVSVSESGSHGSRTRENIQRDVLQRVQEIATRIKELMLSPPYSDSPRFRKLQDMVALWISDLSAINLILETRSDSDDEE